jgi:hypothetical protein
LLRRQHALASIQEILEWKPLEAFKAEHLEFLELLVAYWRELEVEAGASEPDALQLIPSPASSVPLHRYRANLPMPCPAPFSGQVHLQETLILSA